MLATGMESSPKICTARPTLLTTRWQLVAKAAAGGRVLRQVRHGFRLAPPKEALARPSEDQRQFPQPPVSDVEASLSASSASASASYSLAPLQLSMVPGQPQVPRPQGMPGLYNQQRSPGLWRAPVHEDFFRCFGSW
eukprot:TRINITY_DN28837_c1_g2_i1.p3 TRINITY_DN28837_c1_g2~~TRINITY_DN28837_c1_g2_i1.p3  ORF type:complete len:137 (-),score=26.28 TRINITY_DN28837_c1_g2_i1:118-528(-)